MNSDNKLVSIFGSVEDPRSHINRLHNLVDVLLIGIISVICGAETWKQMIEFANSKEKFLRKFLELPNGIPSEDTINRVFSSIDSSLFETCFIDTLFCTLSINNYNHLITLKLSLRILLFSVKCGSLFIEK